MSGTFAGAVDPATTSPSANQTGDARSGSALAASSWPEEHDLGTLAGAPETTGGLAFLRELREATAAQEPVRWQLAIALPERAAMCWSHLSPPAAELAEDRWISRWRESFEYFKLYYRVGPGFVQVVDYRFSSLGVETVFEGQEAREFHSLDSSEGLSTLDVGQSDFTRRLGELNFYLQGSGGGGLLLPIRARRWPVPWFSV